MSNNVDYKIVANSNAGDGEVKAIKETADFVGLDGVSVEKTGGTTDLGADGAPEVILVLKYVGLAITTGFFGAIGADVWKKAKDFIVSIFKRHKRQFNPEEQWFYNPIIVIEIVADEETVLQIQFPNKDEEFEESLEKLETALKDFHPEKHLLMRFDKGRWFYSDEAFKSQAQVRDEIFGWYDFEKITFQNSKKLNLAGALHTPSKPTKTAVIIAHGFASNKDRDRHIQLAGSLAGAGMAAFRIDFGGSGESGDREITIAAQIDDLQSAVRYLKEQGHEHIGVLGESLGGITALQAYNKDIDAMVLWAPVTKSKKPSELKDNEREKELEQNGYIIKYKDGTEFKIPQQYFDERMNVDRDTLFEGINIPVLIIQGDNDEYIPVTHSEEAIEYLPEGSSLEVVEGADHKMDEYMDVVVPKTVKWFKNNLE